MSHWKFFLTVAFAFVLGFTLNHYLATGSSAVDASSGANVATLSPSEPIANNVDEYSPNTVEQPSQKKATPEIADINGFSWERVQQFILDARYDEARQLLQTQLGNPKNVALAWCTLGEIYKAQTQSIASLDARFRCLKLQTDTRKSKAVIAEIKQYLIQLSENPAIIHDDYSWLISQVDELLKYKANDGDLYLLVAGLYVKLKDNYQAQYYAVMALNDPAAKANAERFLEKMNSDKTVDSVNIPLRNFGNQYVVEASVEGYPVRLLLDTGASISGLATSYTEKYPFLLKNTKPIRLNTANGSVNSLLFMVDSFSIGTLVFKQHAFAQLPMDDTHHFDGLLGVDILAQFEFTIDQEASILKLKAKNKSSREP